MKILTLLLVLCAHSAVAQIRHGTATEEIIAKGIYDWAYLNQKDVGLCSLPMVTRGDGDSLVNHHLIVETVMDHVTETTERIYLKTSDQFEPGNCNSHRQNLLESLLRQGGQLPVTLYYFDKLVTNRGSYMGLPFCQKQQFRTIKANINNIPYSKMIKLSEESCK